MAISYFVVGLNKGIYGMKPHMACPSQSTRDEITREVFELITKEFNVNIIGRLRIDPASSCEEIHRTHLKLGSGYYWIATENENALLQYCKF